MLTSRSSLLFYVAIFVSVARAQLSNVPKRFRQDPSNKIANGGKGKKHQQRNLNVITNETGSRKNNLRQSAASDASSRRLDDEGSMSMSMSILEVPIIEPRLVNTLEESMPALQPLDIEPRLFELELSMPALQPEDIDVELLDMSLSMSMPSIETKSTGGSSTVTLDSGGSNATVIAAAALAGASVLVAAAAAMFIRMRKKRERQLDEDEEQLKDPYSPRSSARRARELTFGDLGDDFDSPEHKNVIMKTSSNGSVMSDLHE